jgi:hypothetical protein
MKQVRSRFRRGAAGCLAILLFAVSAAAVAGHGTRAWADDFAGVYNADGKDATGKPYTGAVQIEKLPTLYAVLWKLKGNEAYKGIAIPMDDVLGAAYGPPDAHFGLVVYRIKGGTLDGVWATSGDLKSELGRETLVGSPDLNGTYRIELGENRDGLTNYSGQLRIQRRGDAYFVLWPTKVPSLGIGVRIDDKLVVAYGTNVQKLPGVVAYKRAANGTLSGIWTTVGVKKTGTDSVNIVIPDKVGTETLKRP